MAMEPHASGTVSSPNWKTIVIVLSYLKKDGLAGMKIRLLQVCEESDAAIPEEYSFLILTDKNISESHIALSSLLACSSVHLHLIS